MRSSARTLFVASLLLSAVAAAAPIVATAQTQSWQRRPAPIFRTGAPGSWDDLVVYAPRMLRRTDGNPYVDESGRYYMFYTASGTLDGLNRDATGLARSRTLFEWERALDRPIVERGPFGSYDQGDTSAVTILEEDGTFHLWFEGNARLAGGDFVTINYATSTDALTWSKFDGNPVLRQGPGDDREDLYAPIVLKDGDTWKMWYVGHDAAGRLGLMYATAFAPSGPWIKHSDSFVFYPGDLFPCEVWKERGIYHLLYMLAGNDFAEISLATSADGVTWIPRGVVFHTGPDGAWDDRTVRWPSQVMAGDTWFTFYHANGSSGAGIGVATSRDRYGFVAGGRGVPGPPLDPVAAAAGSDVHITWTPPISGDPVEHYVIETGDVFGSDRFGQFEVAAQTPSISAEVANGRYFIRIRGRNGSGTGPPSHDVSFQVGPCDVAPDAPADVRSSLQRDGPDSFVVTLTWQPVGCPVTGWIVEVGNGPGSADVAAIAINTAASSFTTRAPSGTYFVRVRGRNAFGVGNASPDVRVSDR